MLGRPHQDSPVRRSASWRANEGDLGDPGYLCHPGCCGRPTLAGHAPPVEQLPPGEDCSRIELCVTSTGVPIEVESQDSVLDRRNCSPKSVLVLESRRLRPSKLLNVSVSQELLLLVVVSS